MVNVAVWDTQLHKKETKTEPALNLGNTLTQIYVLFLKIPKTGNWGSIVIRVQLKHSIFSLSAGIILLFVPVSSSMVPASAHLPPMHQDLPSQQTKAGTGVDSEGIMIDVGVGPPQLCLV